MQVRQLIFFSVVGAALLTAGLVSGYYISSTFNNNLQQDRNYGSISNAVLTDSVANALRNDEVVVMVHDSAGNIKSEQKTHNVITSNGAIWFCTGANRCTSQITGSVPAVPNVSSATFWVQFISGTPNTNEPTGADCTSPSGGGAISGQVSGGRCVTNFGASPAQYQAGGSILSVSALAGTAQLRGTGTFDTTNNFVQTTRATICSIVNDGTAPSSGTCQFTDTTPVLTNLSASTITVNGLALSSGTASNAVAGPLIIAEATISAVTLAPGDTISVSWTIVT